jgi:hypothetical protein
MRWLILLSCLARTAMAKPGPGCNADGCEGCATDGFFNPVTAGDCEWRSENNECTLKSGASHCDAPVPTDKDGSCVCFGNGASNEAFCQPITDPNESAPDSDTPHRLN